MMDSVAWGSEPACQCNYHSTREYDMILNVIRRLDVVFVGREPGHQVQTEKFKLDRSVCLSL